MSKNRRTGLELEELNRKAYHLASKTCLENGITSFHDAGSSFKDIRFFHKMIGTKQASIRLWVMVEEDNDSLRQNMTHRILIYIYFL